MGCGASNEKNQNRPNPADTSSDEAQSDIASSDGETGLHRLEIPAAQGSRRKMGGDQKKRRARRAEELRARAGRRRERQVEQLKALLAAERAAGDDAAATDGTPGDDKPPHDSGQIADNADGGAPAEAPDAGDDLDALLGPHVPIRKVTLDDPARLHAARAKFWELGNGKWQEAIDMSHWKFGRFVYDQCLHGGNAYRKEVGYLSSMYDSWLVASAAMGTKATSAHWKDLHFAAMQHPGNDFLNGKFRHVYQHNRAMVSRGYSEKSPTLATSATKEFNKGMPRHMCFLDKEPDSNKDYSHKRNMPGCKRHTMDTYVWRYMDEFYKAVGCAASEADDLERGELRRLPARVPHCDEGFDLVANDDDIADVRYTPEQVAGEREAQQARVARRAARCAHAFEWVVPCPYAVWPPPATQVVDAVAQLHQRLARLEPSRDGNTRTMVVIVNQLLCECGLTPAVFEWPDGAAIMTLEEWRDVIIHGMARWASLLEVQAEADRVEAEHVAEGKIHPFDGAAVTELLTVAHVQSGKMHLCNTNEKRRFTRMAVDQQQRRPTFDALPSEAPPRRMFVCPKSSTNVVVEQRNPFFDK
jgi:hypothetical protein